MNFLQYEFMQKALLAAIVISLTGAAIGRVLVLRRLSQLGDAMSHASLAGVAIGLIFSVNPLITAALMTVVAALTIELLRRIFPQYEELSIAIVFSASVGLAGVLSGFSPQGNFSSFLFGSIVAVTDGELIMVCVVSAACSLLVRLFRWSFCYLCFDEEMAAISGLKTSALNILFSVLTALTISMAARTVGALVVSSMLVLPMACAMQLELSYVKTGRAAMAFALFFSIVGLVCSFYFDLKPGGSIVLLGVLTLLVVLVIRNLRKNKRPSETERR